MDSTVYDVAKKASVSIATVSRVLNSPDKVSEATRKRVFLAMDALGFVPKAEAAARARKAGQRIGVLAPFFTFPSFVERLRGVVNALSGSPYELSMFNVDSSARRDAYLSSLAVSRRMDGLILMALPFDDALAHRLISHQVEVVMVEGGRPEFTRVDIDDQAGGQMAAHYLLEKGHRRCAFVGGDAPPDYAMRTSDWRLAGYRQALESADMPLREEYVALAPHGLDSACQSAHRLLDLPEPPTAIFSPSDTQSMGVLKAARERGVSVPEQLAVIGFDDIEIADYIGLTTVRQPLEESGRVAVELLLARLVDRTRPAQQVRLPLSIVRRHTA